MLAVQPKPEGLTFRKVILSASRCCPPPTKPAPLTGLTRLKSSVATSAELEPRLKCPSLASRHSKWIVSPGLHLSAGVKWRLQAKFGFLRWIVWVQGAHLGLPSGRVV